MNNQMLLRVLHYIFDVTRQEHFAILARMHSVSWMIAELQDLVSAEQEQLENLVDEILNG